MYSNRRSTVNRLSKIIFLLLTDFATTYLHAQGFWRNYEVGAQLGTYVYQGDLTPIWMGSYNTLKWNGGVHITRLMSPNLAVRLQYNAGHLLADDAAYNQPDWRQQRNFNANTRVRELMLTGNWDFTGQQLQRKPGTLSPYLFGGLGYSWLHVHRSWSKMNSEYFASSNEMLQGLATDTTTRMPRGMMIVPVGAGLRYTITKRIGVFAEAAYRFSFSNDYLDGFSKAANSSSMDHYYGYSIGLIIGLGKMDALACPPNMNGRK